MCLIFGVQYIYVTKGEYNENINITSKSIALFGEAPVNTEINSGISISNSGLDYTIVNGFTIGGATAVSINDNSKAYLSNNIIQGNTGILNKSHVILKNNVIRNSENGLLIPSQNTAPNIIIYNNVFFSNISAINFNNDQNNASGSVLNNLITDCTYGITAVSSSTANPIDFSYNGFYQNLTNFNNVTSDGGDITLNPDYIDYFVPDNTNIWDAGFNPPSPFLANWEFLDRTSLTHFSGNDNANMIGLYGGPEAFKPLSDLLPSSIVGIEDGINITLDINTFNTNYPYLGYVHYAFNDAFPYGDYIVQWNNTLIKASYSCGEVTVMETQGSLILIPTLPEGYFWERDESGNVVASLYKSGIDNLGYYHEASVEIKIANVPYFTSGILNSNTTWCGEITITGNITVPSAFTLKVNPGAVIKFTPNSSLLLYGKLEAMGCTFTSQSGTASDRWGNINFYSSGASNSLIKFTQIKNGTKIQINNASNVKIQNCNFTEVSQGIHYYNSSGEFSGNTYTSSSIYHGFVAEGSSVYCYNNKLTKQSPNEKRGWGIYYGGGASGFIYKNDLYGWDVGVGAIYGSSPHFRPDPAFFQYQNNRIRNCKHGVHARNDSWPVVGGPSTGYGRNSIYGNTKNIYFTSGGTLWAYAAYFGGTPTSSMFQTTSGSTIDYSYWLSEDPWIGIPKVSSETEVITAGGSLSPESTNDPESFFYGIDLRNQNKYKEAKDFFISYLDKNPNDQAAYVELYNCYNSETSADLISYFIKLPKQASKNHKFLLANLYLKEGKINEAKNVNNEIAADNPNSILSARSKLNRINIALYNEDNIYDAITLFEETASKRNLSDAEELSFVKEKILNHAKVRGIESIPELQNSAALKRDFIAEACNFDLLGNYPNPFNPTTTISYNLPYESDVELKIYDIVGREVKSFNIASQSSGYQSIFWDGTNENGIQVASGIYLYRITLKSLENNEMFVKTAKLMMLK